jgi:hypothetical protein
MVKTHILTLSRSALAGPNNRLAITVLKGFSCVAAAKRQETRYYSLDSPEVMYSSTWLIEDLRSG